jgi:hypothetical protein
MIPDTNPRKILTFGGRKESNDCVAIACLVNSWLPESIIFVGVALRFRDLLNLFHKVFKAAARFFEVRK